MDKNKREAIKEYLNLISRNDEEFLKNQVKRFENDEIEILTITEFKQEIKDALIELNLIKKEYLEQATREIFNEFVYVDDPVCTVFVYEGEVYLFDVDDWYSVIERKVEVYCNPEWWVD